MARVTLETLWLSAVDDPLDCLGLEHVTVLSPETSVNGRFSVGANSRRRLIVQQNSTSHSYDVTVEHAPRWHVQWLEDHVGVVLMLTDPMGRLVYGAYLSVKPGERRGENQADVSFTLSEVTVDVAV